MIHSLNIVPILDDDGSLSIEAIDSVTVRTHEKGAYLVALRVRDGSTVTVNAADLEHAIANAKNDNRFGGGR